MSLRRVTDERTSSFARRLLSADISRRKLIEGRPTSFIQWYIILEIYIAASEDRPVVITDLIHLAGHPRSTTLKAIADLVGSGNLRRTPDPTDRRRVFISLEHGFHIRVDSILLELMEAYDAQ